MLVDGSSDNEVELIDILRVFKRRWRLILIGVFLFSLCGVVISVWLPKQYQFSSVIQIGRAPDATQTGQKNQLYESPETVIAKLRDVYIPLSVQKFSAEGVGVPKVELEHPKNSDLVQLVTTAGPDFQKIVSQLHSQIIGLLQQDHEHRKERFALALEADISRAKLRLQELQDPLEQSLREKRSQAAITSEQNLVKRLQGEVQIYSQQLKLLSVKKDQLQKRVEELRAALKLAQENRSDVVENLGSESRAITLVMLDHQIDLDRTQLSEIENTLLFGLDDQREALEQKIAINLREQDRHKTRIEELKNSYLKGEADNQRQQQSQKQTLDELQGRLTLNEETRTVSLAVRSAALAGPRPIMVIALSFVCGGFVTLFIAFFVDYIRSHPLIEP